MFPIRLHKRKAISAVLTTIIVLVASIVLGTGVVVFSTGLFQTGGQSQSVQINGLREWVNATNTTAAAGGTPGVGWGAFAVKNTGDKLLAISSITARGVSMPYTNWYIDANQSRVGSSFQAQLNYTNNDKSGFLKGTAGSGGVVALGPGGACPGQQPQLTIVIQEVYKSTTAPALCLQKGNGPVSLTPGSSAVIYYNVPSGIFTTTDSGVSGTVSILAGTAPVSQTVRIGNP